MRENCLYNTRPLPSLQLPHNTRPPSHILQKSRPSQNRISIACNPTPAKTPRHMRVRQDPHFPRFAHNAAFVRLDTLHVSCVDRMRIASANAPAPDCRDSRFCISGRTCGVCADFVSLQLWHVHAGLYVMCGVRERSQVQHLTNIDIGK